MPIYVRSAGAFDARIMFIGEIAGEDEETDGEPMTGYTGRELQRMCAEAKISWTSSFRANVFRFCPRNKWGRVDVTSIIWFPGDGDEGIPQPEGWIPIRGAYVRPDAVSHLADLDKEIKALKPNVICALGKVAMWALNGLTTIDKLRSSVYATEDGRKFIPTYNPAHVTRNWHLRSIMVSDLRRVQSESAYPEIREPDRKLVLRPTYDQALFLLSHLQLRLESGLVRIVADLETRKGQIACIGIAIDKTSAFCIPILCKERPEGYWSLDEEVEIIKRLRSILTHTNIRLVGQNFLYDSQYIVKQWGFVPNVWMDTMIQWHTLFLEYPKSLDFIASMTCAWYRYWKEDAKEWDERKMNEDELWRYCCLDCTYTFECMEEIEKLKDALKLREQCEFEQSLFEPVLSMMIRGFAQDVPLRKEVSKMLKAERKKRLDWIESILGHPFNPRSTDQKRALFYGDLKIEPVKKRTRHGWKVTTDDDALRTIADREPILTPIIHAISQSQSLGVYDSTFASSRLSEDQRLRSSINVAGAVTTRFSSSRDAFGSGGNMQNQPKGLKLLETLNENGPLTLDELSKLSGVARSKLLDELEPLVESGYVVADGDKVRNTFYLPNIRRFFVADEGMELITADLERADLQVVVWEMDDAELKAILRSGVDFHAETAKQIHMPRQVGKEFIHLTNYGGKAKKAAKTFHMAEAVAYNTQRMWFSAHPGLPNWHRRVESQAERGCVPGNFGVKRFVMNTRDINLPEYLAWNPQMTVAQVINRGSRQLYERMPEVQQLLQVHDELVMQVPKGKALEWAPRIREALKVTIPYSDPLTIPHQLSYGPNWGDLTKIKEAA